MREGKYGPYIKHGSTNATLPKSAVPEDVTLEEALALVSEKEAKSGKKKPAKKAAAKKEPVERKAPAKKASVKKPAAKKKAPARKTAAKKPAAKASVAKKSGKATEMAD